MNSKRTRKRYNKNSKILIIMVLMIGVIGLSIGFSAFSKNLDINSTATVTPDPSDFKILFSSSKDSVVDGYIYPWAYNPDEDSTKSKGDIATIDNTDPTHPKITGIKATFMKENREIGYGLYVTNQGRYDAYLKKIEFGDKKCTAKPGTSQTLVNQACNSITLHIRFVDTGESSNLYNVSNNMVVSNHPLRKGTSEGITVWIDYFPDAAVFADGDFDVTFGDITLTYSSSDS